MSDIVPCIGFIGIFILLGVADVYAQSWEEDPNQHMLVDMRLRLFRGERTFGSYRPRPTRLLNMLPGFTSQADVRLSPYGGWADRKIEGTGFFRTEKIDGRWWFVDPEGYLFFCTGLNSIRWGSPKDRSVTAPPIVESRWASPQAWAHEAVGFLRTNSFNVVGPWSDPLLLKTEHKRPQPWTTVIYMMYPFGRRFGATPTENNMQFPNQCMPIFNSEFEEY